ncbi:origin recognition complex subunit 2-like [Saccoglossus kowalevskii]|uniref:Origin recognition complex subunit 2 n=1 Tax=Saccoglossus kowalevskii TaxID=10224 RepID=A0ABM0H1Z6_SACKO|nr:PREDICTED: origin recognition complex subunit 2-like [Saccoglossus kowalevskii]
MAASGGKHVKIRFVGNEDVVEHLKDTELVRNYGLRQRKNSDKRQSIIIAPVQKRNGVGNSINQESDDDSSDSEMDVDPISSNILIGEHGISGSDVYAFQTPKRSGKMAELAALCKTPSSVRKTPGKKLQASATPSSSKKTPKRKTVRIVEPGEDEEDTEQSRSGLRRSSRRRIPVDEDSESSSNSDDDVSSEVSSSVVSSVKSKTPSETSTPSRTPTRSSSRMKTNGDLTQMAEEYFEAQSGTVVTSDRTLSRLNTPRMNQEELNNVLECESSSHQIERQELYDDYRELFNKWMFQLSNGFNLILYGLGSKRVLLDEFRDVQLSEFTHVVINGFFPSITIKSILNTISEEALDHSGSFRNPIEQCEFIKQHLEKNKEELFLIIHNIDGSMLRGEKTQNILSLLVQSSKVHLVATIDHINAPLVWDQTKSSRFNWLWYDVTTYEPYIEETSYENSLLVQQSGVLALSSLTHVMRSLTPNARGIFLLLARYQMEQKDNSSYIGMSFQDLYQKCRESFLVNSDLTLRAQLTEFRDHKLIIFKKGVDGLQYLTIPIDEATITEYMTEEAETT